MELGLLLLTIAATILLIGGGILVVSAVSFAVGASGYLGAKAGAALGFLASAFLWQRLLKYYRYEAHSLRPIKDETTVTPGGGRDKNEG